MRFPWAPELLTGRFAPLRLLIPVLGAGYMVLLGETTPTVGQWICLIAAAVLSLLGGWTPLPAAIGLTTLLLIGEVLDLGNPLALKILATFAVFEVAVRRPLNQALISGAALTATYFWIFRFHETFVDVLEIGYKIAFLVVAPLLLGAYLRSNAETVRQAKLVTATADRRRAEAEQAARLAERTEVAREIHDLIAHHVASIALRTAVAREVLPDIDPQVRRVLDEVHEAAAIALGDLKKLVTVLRDPTAVSSGNAAFGPGLLEPSDLPASLTSVFERTSAAGVQVDGTVSEGLNGLDAVRALAVLRTVQEGLTNVTKHVGSGARVKAAVDLNCGLIRITIADDGGGAVDLAGVGAARGLTVAGGKGVAGKDPNVRGHGLIGLSERLELLGGRVEAGPYRGGAFAAGWRLTAEFPPVEETHTMVSRLASRMRFAGATP